MPKVKLGDVAIESRETYKGDKRGLPIVGLEHITPEEVTLSNWATDTENTFTKMFRKGDMLFGRRRAYLKKAAQAPFDGICSGDITVIRAKLDKLLPDLLPFIIQNDDLFDFAVGKSAGSLSPRVKWENLKNYTFELLPLDEQKKLAEVLWSINDTIQAYQKLLVETDELVKSQFIEMFGDCIDNERGWKELPLCDVLAEGRTVTYGIVQTEDDTPGGIPVFRPVDISQGHIPTRSELKRTRKEISDKYKRTLLSGNELLITVRGSIGETFQISSEFEGCNVARNIVPLVSNAEILDQGFLKAVLDSEAFQRKLAELTKGVALKGINMSEFKMCPIILPPMELQLRAVEFIKQSDKSKFALQSAITSLQATKRSIIDEAFGIRRKE